MCRDRIVRPLISVTCPRLLRPCSEVSDTVVRVFPSAVFHKYVARCSKENFSNTLELADGPEARSTMPLLDRLIRRGFWLTGERTLSLPLTRKDSRHVQFPGATSGRFTERMDSLQNFENMDVEKTEPHRKVLKPLRGRGKGKRRTE